MATTTTRRRRIEKRKRERGDPAMEKGVGKVGCSYRDLGISNDAGLFNPKNGPLPIIEI